MSKKTKATKATKATKQARTTRRGSKTLETALANAIKEIGALIETCSNPSDLRQASRVLRSLAYIATLQASACQYRAGGSIGKAAQQEHTKDRVYAELPTEAKW